MFSSSLRPRTRTQRDRVRERSGQRMFKYIDLYGSVHERSGAGSEERAGDERRTSSANQCSGIR